MPAVRRPRRSPRASAAQALALAAGLTAVLALTACASPTSAPERDAATVTAPADLVSGDPDTWPLTGLAVRSGDDSVQAYPPLVVKVDNTSGSAPQVGLGAADLVVEEMVEGGVTRLAAFYYSRLPDRVGPVRSMRASDLGIVSPVGASMVTSGAAAVTIRRVRDAGIPFFEEETSAGFSRDTSRPVPYNLFADLTEIETLALADEGRPADYLPFGRAPRGGERATTVDARFSGSRTTSWTYTDGRYTSLDSFADPDDEFPTSSVLVLRVEVGDAGYRDPAGNAVPETVLTGTGEALLFHGGRVVRGTWSKADLAAPLRLATAGGAELRVPPGHTWIELVPVSGGDVTYD